MQGAVIDNGEILVAPKRQDEIGNGFQFLVAVGAEAKKSVAILSSVAGKVH